MIQIKTFRDLIAWQKGIQLAKEVYRITRAYPDTERFGPTMQMRRAAVSIPSNVAEGHARGVGKDFLRFLRIARGSLAELQTQLLLAIELELETAPDPVLQQITEVDRIVQGLIRSLERK